jgi:hypothetical protein
MTYHIIIEPTAEREIRSAVRSKTEHTSPTAAARWYNGLIRKIETLRHHPTRCPLAAENDKFDEEIRELLYGTGGKQAHHHRIILTSVKIRSRSSMSVTPPVTSWSPERFHPRSTCVTGGPSAPAGTADRDVRRYRRGALS